MTGACFCGLKGALSSYDKRSIWIKGVCACVGSSAKWIPLHTGSTEYDFVGMALHAGLFSGSRALLFCSDGLVSVSKDENVVEKDWGRVDTARNGR